MVPGSSDDGSANRSHHSRGLETGHERRRIARPRPNVTCPGPQDLRKTSAETSDQVGSQTAKQRERYFLSPPGSLVGGHAGAAAISASLETLDSMNGTAQLFQGQDCPRDRSLVWHRSAGVATRPVWREADCGGAASGDAREPGRSDREGGRPEAARLDLRRDPRRRRRAGGDRIGAAVGARWTWSSPTRASVWWGGSAPSRSKTTGASSRPTCSACCGRSTRRCRTSSTAGATWSSSASVAGWTSTPGTVALCHEQVRAAGSGERHHPRNCVSRTSR